MLKTDHKKEGIYTAKNTFTTGGIYYVQSHVTARSLHSMPKKKIHCRSSFRSCLERA
ncbi:hypothetical protein CVD28_08020 [Bacillus sp. M6-12]|nr:hypothetical protein CVD28_08020 [Bacillus sp. M6-12]